MLEQLIVNMSAHLKFFRRNRLLLGFAVVVLFIMGMSSIPAFFLMTSTKHFEIIKRLFMQLNGFAVVFTAALGLFLVSSHLRSRSIKMVLTKPCLPEIWLLSGFLSAALVSFAIHIIVLMIVLIFSGIMGVSIVSGYLFMSANSFITSIIFLGYLMFLSMAMHPVLAVIVSLIMNEGMFYNLKFFMLVISGASGSTLAKRSLLRIMDIMYMVLPITDPLNEKSRGVSDSLRVAGADWINLLTASGYMVSISVLFYFLADYFFRKKSLI